MTRRRIVAALSLLALVGAGVLVWRVFFPGEKALIVRRLNAAADAVAVTPGESGAAALVKLHRVESLLDARIDCRVRFRRQTWNENVERGLVLSALGALRKNRIRLSVKLDHFRVTVDGDSARVEAEAQIDAADAGGKWKDSRQEDVVFGLVRRNGEWLISEVAVRDFMVK